VRIHEVKRCPDGDKVEPAEPEPKRRQVCGGAAHPLDIADTGLGRQPRSLAQHVRFRVHANGLIEDAR
jgi:hypothetical protein